MDTLRVLVEHDPDDGFVAQCVDFDIIGFGDDHESALQDFIRAVIVYVAAAVRMGEVPFQSERRPPREYAERWERARPTLQIEELQIPYATIPSADRLDLSRLPRSAAALVA